MLSKNQAKHISSLKLQKFRQESGQFVAEGHKLVTEFLRSRFEVIGIYALPEWIGAHQQTIDTVQIPVVTISLQDMHRISMLSSPSPVLAVVKIPPPARLTALPPYHLNSLSLALDDIRDPGNMGTMIRMADWFGISEIYCSESCVELYNPKVVQATMGSITRINVSCCNLRELLQSVLSYGDHAVYGAFLEGDSLYKEMSLKPGVLLIGNESRGISPELEACVTHKIFIPYYGAQSGGKAESLNASVAAAIICAEFRRKSI